MIEVQKPYYLDGHKYHDYDQEKFIKELKVGDYIWDCRYKRRKIISITTDGKNKLLDFSDRQGCSARDCASPYKWT